VKAILLLSIALGSVIGPGAVNAPLRAQAVQVLRASLENEQRWIKVHAAEALVDAGQPDEVARAFEREFEARGAEPEYRVGIWRVLAQAASTAQQRQPWITKIVAAFLDAGGPDRLHAAETLGKLGYRVSGADAGAFERVARAGRGSLAADARWVLANSGQAAGDAPLAELLSSDDRGTRNDAAYAMRHLAKLSSAGWEKLAAATGKSKPGDGERVTLLSAAFVHAPIAQRARFKAELLKYFSNGTNDEKFEVCAALAGAGVDSDLRLLTPLLNDSTPDVRIGAAHAVLKISQRQIR
jgi:hypothetical protein